MKKLLFKMLIIMVSLGLFHACEKAEVKVDSPEEMDLKSGNSSKTSYIVILNDSDLDLELSQMKGYERRQAAVKSSSAKIMRRAGIDDGELGLVYGTALKGFSVMLPPGQLKKLENDPSVQSVIEDKLITLVNPGTEKAITTGTQITPWGITRVNGGATYTGNKVAWVIDTGIDLDHPDLNVDTDRGKTFVTRTTTADDDNGHGSHVAGIIAAIDNGEGVVGVAAGATVVPVKVLDRRGSGYNSWIIGGIDYVAEVAAEGDVANMSLGGSLYLELNDAVIAAASNGVLFALAAGNESTDASTKSPASANHSNIYTISAMAEGDVWASYSNYGNPPIDFCEPGSSIYSTYKSGGYATLSGTSMASPHMAGILMWGVPVANGVVSGDPDGDPDPIGVVGGEMPNISPVANAGPDQTKTDSDENGFESFTLDGSGSSDSDGSIISYEWKEGETSLGSGITLTKDFAVGTHVVSLTVSDDEGATDTDEVVITVNGAVVNQDPVAGFSAATDGLTASFTDQSTDDGSIVSWSWNFGDGSTSTVQNPSHTYGSGNTYTVTLTVTDNGGATDSDQQSVTVTDPVSGDIVLTATARKIRGIRIVDLSWSGNAGNVDIYKDGVLVEGDVPGSEYEHNLGRVSGTFTYRVCETGSSSCSNEVTVTI